MSARLYFDLVNSHESLPDRDGIEVDDVSQAEAILTTMVDELRQEEPCSAQDWSGWTLKVSDDAGRVLFSMDLDSQVQ